MRDAVDRVADADDGPGRLVTEHQRCVHDEAAHPAVPVVVGVRAADAHRGHPYQHVTGSGVGIGRSSISMRPGSTSTAARILASDESVVCVTFTMLT